MNMKGGIKQVAYLATTLQLVNTVTRVLAVTL